jgi:hypothetical protein
MEQNGSQTSHASTRWSLLFSLSFLRALEGDLEVCETLIYVGNNQQVADIVIQRNINRIDGRLVLPAEDLGLLELPMDCERQRPWR